MRPHDLTLFAAACIIALAGCSSNRAPAPEAPHAISVADLRDAGVIGRLGRPLGTMMTVTGVAVPNTSLRKADAGEALFLRITTVDGKPLDVPVEFPFRKAHEIVDVPEPLIGQAFSYRGFETGGFEGVPLNYGAPWQAIGFHFNDEYFVLPNK